MTHLEFVIRIVGFAAAALGTCAAVPAASWRLVKKVREQATSVANMLLRRRPTPEPGNATAFGTAAFSGTGTLTATGHVVGNSVEERLERLEQRVDVVSTNQQRTAADLRQEVTDRMQSVNELRAHVDAEVGRLDQTLDDQQQGAEEVDARALPVVLVGAALSSFPDLLSLNAVVAVLAVLLGLGLLARAAVLLRRARRTACV